MNTLSIPTLLRFPAEHDREQIDQAKDHIIEVLCLVEARAEECWIKPPCTVLDVFWYMGRKVALGAYRHAAKELCQERKVRLESANGMLRVYLAHDFLEMTSTMPVVDYQGDEGDEQPRTISQIASTEAAKELDERAAKFPEVFDEFAADEEVTDAPAERELWRNR